MFYQVELFLLGVATVFDTVLLLIVLERVNRSQISNWLYALLVGLWLVHASSFVHEVVRDVPGNQWVSQFMVGLTCGGLLLLPSAMLHAALWLNFGRPEHQWRYALLYLPLASLPLIAWHLSTTSSTTFMEAVAPLAGMYLTEVVLFNLLSIGLFYRMRYRLAVAGADRFFTRLAALLVWMTVLIVFYYTITDHLWLEEVTRAVLILSPLFPALLFVWHALNQRLLPLVMERTLLYGATLVILLFLHRLLIEPIANRLQARAHVDVLMVEGWLLIALVLAWPPLRGRFREAVRYLFSSNVHQIREATSQLSLEMSQRAWQSTEELAEWMAGALRSAIAVDSIVIVQVRRPELPGAGSAAEVNAACEPSFHCIASHSTVEAVADRQHSPELATELTNELTNDLSGHSRELCQVYTAVCASARPYLFRGQRLHGNCENAMQRLGVLWAVRMQFQSVRGMLLVGPRQRNDRLADEQLNSLALLVEQFAATLHNRQLEQMRLRAERHAMQQEKLSMLGLLAGTLSHELRNPLSSMRTIAQLMREDLKADDPHKHDVGLILGEIDRLTQTTTRLLDFSRPASDQTDVVYPERVLSRLLSILEHLARQRRVLLELNLTAGECTVAGSDASLSEILFNLIKNAIEAASSIEHGQGKVGVATQRAPDGFLFTVSDNGPGMTAEVQATMFEPFVTGKADGTGLGLYIVAQRVRELQGNIRCDSQSSRGTRFEIQLPYENTDCR